MRTVSRLAAMTLGLGLVVGAGMPDAAAQSRNCIDTLASMPEYQRYLDAVARASMSNDLRALQNVTIFAPTNAAIQAVPPELRDRIFPTNASDGGSREADPVLAPAALQAHIVQGRMPAAALAAGVQLQTMAGTRLSTSATRGTGAEPRVTVSGGPGVSAQIVQPDVACANGVIQGIDRVLIR